VRRPPVGSVSCNLLERYEMTRMITHWVPYHAIFLELCDMTHMIMHWVPYHAILLERYERYGLTVDEDALRIFLMWELMTCSQNLGK